jgi:hypothetical protein
MPRPQIGSHIGYGPGSDQARKGMMRDDKSGAPSKDDRKARLAEQLRANLQKRKAQARARRSGEADSRPEGIAVARKPAK